MIEQEGIMQTVSLAFSSFVVVVAPSQRTVTPVSSVRRE